MTAKECFKIKDLPDGDRFLTWEEMVRWVVDLRKAGVIGSIKWETALYFDEE